MEADCSERGTHLHVCLNETFRDVCPHLIFLAALPFPLPPWYSLKRQMARCEDHPWSFSCLCDVACFVFCAWLFLPSQPPNFETFILQTVLSATEHSTFDHPARITLSLLFSLYFDFWLFLLVYGPCFPNLIF